MTTKIEDAAWEPVGLLESFRFPLVTIEARRDLLAGGTVLLIPFIGWILNLGHRLEVVRRLARGDPPYFRGFAPWGWTFRRGIAAFTAIVTYLLPAAAFGMAALLFWRAKGPAWAIVVHATLAAICFLLAIYVLPGGMTHNAAHDDLSYLYRPDKALLRSVEGGRRYLASWGIALCAIGLSLLGLLLAGVGFLYTSVWAWSVVGYAFSRALVVPMRAR